MSAPFGLAVVGTNWITNSFVQSCHESKLFTLTAVYSRKLDTANSFISETPSIKDASKVEAYDDLDTMLSKGSNIDVVYIASPNSLHYEQGIKALNAGKHVIMEKPFASNMKELEALYELADSKGLFILEAYRHIQEPNFKTLQRLLDDEKTRSEKFGKIYGANLSMAVYSPLFGDITEGNVPNVASPKFSGGCLWDMGCYPVTFAVRLFGKPSSQTYFPVVLETRVDGGGLIVFHYTPESSKHQQSFTLSARTSKLYDSHAPTEIYCEKGTIKIFGSQASNVTDICTMKFFPRGSQESKELGDISPEYTDMLNLTWEAKELGRIIKESDREAEADLRELSRSVLTVMEDMRKKNGIVFGSDS
ncbi:oxidoreductase yulF [Fusarium subglutinans]|uniref:Oxidoreductase yulF n=1 Tax=Gibberella subglutinans TaxID=42677 RepID=A0A8H5PJK0_GIBSU|nr:oxidoreductase yulF [Fusarium subglutinans]KAF5597486.1 oxidoreductase yulF [Fusarium subglutinans]